MSNQIVAGGGGGGEYRAGIFKHLKGARNRVGIRLLYRPARLHRLEELIPWNRFLGSLKVYKFGLSMLGMTVNLFICGVRGGGAL